MHGDTFWVIGTRDKGLGLNYKLKLRDRMEPNG
jgi:hypothetical protein